MKKFSKIIFCLFLVLISLNVYSQDKSHKIDDLVNQYFDFGQFNGSVLVSENGNVILDKGYGYANMEWKIPNTPDTKFRLGSITKQFTSMLIMQLSDQGKIDLNGKLSDYLPEYRKDIGEKVTIHNLLTHTSGIPNYTNDPEFMRKTIRNPFTVDELVLTFCSGDLEFEPGSKYSYSNSGYVILGAVIEKVTGKEWEEVLKENILNPLNMINTGYDHTSQIIENRASGYDKSFDGFVNANFMDMSIPYSAGAMYSTVNDMFKWDQALYTDKIISTGSKEKMFTPFLDSYGYGWKIKEAEIGNIKKKLITHSGGIFGFNTTFLRFPEDNNCIILLNNFSSGNLDELSKGISEILYDQKYEMARQSITDLLYESINANDISAAAIEFSKLKNDKDKYKISEREINMLGYTLMRDRKINEAIEVFKFNTELFPESANVYDSLGEAYLTAGDKDQAILNYQRSVKLDPKNETGKKTLNKLQNK